MVQRTRVVIWSTESLADKKAVFSYWNNRNKSTLYTKKLNILLDEKAKLKILLSEEKLQ